MFTFLLKKNTRGFTLIELLLVISISSFLLLSLFYFLHSILETQRKQVVIQEVEDQGAFVIDEIYQLIYNAPAVVEPLGLGTSTQHLELSHPTNNIDPIEIFIDTGALIYQENGNTNTQQELTGANVIVDDFTVTNRTPSGAATQVLDVYLSLSFDNQSGKPIFDYQKDWVTTVLIRNYD